MVNSPHCHVLHSSVYVLCAGGCQEQHRRVLLQLQRSNARPVYGRWRNGQTCFPCDMEGHSSTERSPVRDHQRPAQCRPVLII